MKRVKNPCLGCIHRHIGCHSDCERYAEWRDFRAAEMQHLSAGGDVIRFKIDGIRKVRAYIHKHKPR